MKITKQTSVLILSHYYKLSQNSGGPPQEIRNYLLTKVTNLYYIEHPFPYAKEKISLLTVYQNGKVVKTYKLPSFGPQMLYYLLDIIKNWYFIIRIHTRIDLCIALDPLNTTSLIPFRKLGIIKTLVLYSIDYSPKRFANLILNKFYHIFDKLACYHADAIWPLSNRIIEGRTIMGIDPKKSAKNIILPMGADLRRIKILLLSKLKRQQLIFVGHLLEKQGIQLILELLSEVIKKIPQTTFIIIGQGEYEKTLKQTTKRLKLEKHVIFKGFVKKHQDVEKMLCESAIGIAPYIPSSDNYTYYTDPGKPKLYLGCGLPVVITKFPEIAKVIEEEKAGFALEYNKESFLYAILTLLQNDKIYKAYRKHAIKLGKRYDTTKLIANAISKL